MLTFHGDFRISSDATKIADSDCELAQVLIDTWAELADCGILFPSSQMLLQLNHTFRNYNKA